MNLPAMATTCFVTGNEFVEDERVVSHLVRQASDGEIVRLDVKEESEPEFETPGRVVCRWTHPFKPKLLQENPERDLKLTAETLFLTLADPNAELSPDDSRLVQFLALMLERKRMIKPRGRTADGAKDIYEHRGSKTRCEVPVGELNPAFFIAVQEQLSVLVGSPDEASEGASVSESTDGNANSAPVSAVEPRTD
ncbi:hypothetical protein [Synoicihabitans lomoniglobus]|uniref:Uncharacterized protein n=1 Tax=Synoicihabitans lomoniglobus TaxID=2909285 RepID=A0AAF0CSF7_9BACT|nr:hypothetical protein [Opitutaceae bacterium LMO-M01]WED67195.1 hypothetical protein PXH66_10060 [Opitutaceae bacterium LMO-M01]